MREPLIIAEGWRWPRLTYLFPFFCPYGRSAGSIIAYAYYPLIDTQPHARTDFFLSLMPLIPQPLPLNSLALLTLDLLVATINKFRP